MAECFWQRGDVLGAQRRRDMGRRMCGETGLVWCRENVLTAVYVSRSNGKCFDSFMAGTTRYVRAGEPLVFHQTQV